MKKTYQTGEKAPESGMYVCELNGLEKSFREGETFDLCPETWTDTTWSKKHEK